MTPFCRRLWDKKSKTKEKGACSGNHGPGSRRVCPGETAGYAGHLPGGGGEEPRVTTYVLIRCGLALSFAFPFITISLSHQYKLPFISLICLYWLKPTYSPLFPPIQSDTA